MKKDTLFRTLNGVGVAANGTSFFMPLGSPQYAACKAVSLICNVTSFAMIFLQYSKILRTMDQKEMSGRDGSMLKFTAHETVCMAAAALDAKTFQYIGAEHLPSPETLVLENSISMATQLLNVIGGMDPQKKAQQVDQYKA